jgi:methionyl-tRNA formyltransferase
VEESADGGGDTVRILFWGTPYFALPSLGALAGEGHEIVGVVTQPDRPAGRGRKLRESPVKQMAEEEGFLVLQPERPWGDPFLEQIRSLEPGISVVVAYGHILKPEVLAVPPHGSINLHASLLPELRGAAPINWAIVRGYESTGVTVIRMVKEMDAGPILFQNEEPILEGETASDLSLRLSEVGAGDLVETLALLEGGVLEEVEQDHARATYGPKVTRELARVDWDRPSLELSNHIRGMDDVPGAWTLLGGQPVKVFRPSAAAGEGSPGTVLVADPTEGLVVATADGALKLDEVQPAGRRRMLARDWISGRGVEAGQTFD